MARAFKGIFTCKIWLRYRYSRERALSALRCAQPPPPMRGSRPTAPDRTGGGAGRERPGLPARSGERAAAEQRVRGAAFSLPPLHEICSDFLRFCRKMPKNASTSRNLSISNFQFNFHHDYTGDFFFATMLQASRKTGIFD